MAKPFVVCSPNRDCFVYKDGRLDRFELLVLDAQQQALLKKEFEKQKIAENRLATQMATERFMPAKLSEPVETDMGFVCAAGFRSYSDKRKILICTNTGPIPISIVNIDATRSCIKISVLEANIIWGGAVWPEFSLTKETILFADLTGKRLKLQKAENGGPTAAINHSGATDVLKNVSYQVFSRMFPALYIARDVGCNNLKILKAIFKNKWISDTVPLTEDMFHSLCWLNALGWFMTDVRENPVHHVPG